MSPEVAGPPLRAVLHHQGSGKGPASAWRPSTGSSPRAAGTSTSRASRARVPPSDLLPALRAAAPCGPSRRGRALRRGAERCWWWRTTRWSAESSCRVLARRRLPGADRRATAGEALGSSTQGRAAAPRGHRRGHAGDGRARAGRAAPGRIPGLRVLSSPGTPGRRSRSAGVLEPGPASWPSRSPRRRCSSECGRCSTRGDPAAWPVRRTAGARSRVRGNRRSCLTRRGFSAS